MPVFNYKCTSCGFTEDYIESTSVSKDKWHPDNCPSCTEGTLEKDFAANIKGQLVYDVPGGYAWDKKVDKINKAIMNPTTTHNTNPY